MERDLWKRKSDGRLSLHWASDRFHHKTLLVAESQMIRSKQILILDDLFLAKAPTFGAVSSGSHNQDSFHRAIGPALVLGQVFGLMPVTGVLGKDASHLKFKWLSRRMLHSFVLMLGSGLLCFSSLFRLLIMGVNIENVGKIVFYGSTFFTLVLFLRLAPAWPRLGRAIAKQEEKRAPRSDKHLTLRIRFTLYCFFVLFLALVEHVLSMISGFFKVIGCEKDHGHTIEHIYTSSYPQIFYYTDYAHWKAVFLQILNVAATFNWNYMDLFITLISLGLVDRFEQLNYSLDAAIGKNLPEHFWRATRSEYAHLAQLVKMVDDGINEIMLLSFTNNLYIICQQLFNSLNSVHDEKHDDCEDLVDRGIVTMVYFLFSFAFLIGRFLMVALTASRLHTASRGPLNALFSVSSESYCIEVRRFLDQVTADTVALTGLNFFYITRGLILTIAGTVVTYELVLVQFNSPVSAAVTINETCMTTTALPSALTALPTTLP